MAGGGEGDEFDVAVAEEDVGAGVGVVGEGFEEDDGVGVAGVGEAGAEINIGEVIAGGELGGDGLGGGAGGGGVGGLGADKGFGADVFGGDQGVEGGWVLVMVFVGVKEDGHADLLHVGGAFDAHRFRPAAANAWEHQKSSKQEQRHDWHDKHGPLAGPGGW